MFTYRNSREEDFAQIAAFPKDRAEAFYMYPKGEFPLQASQLYDTSKSSHLPTVIEYEGVIAGYCNLYDLSVNDHAWIGNVIINPKFRGRGAGVFLILTIMERARMELEVNELRLVCHNPNTAAVLFYEKMGFKPFDIRRMKDYNGLDIAGIMMKLTLEQMKSHYSRGINSLESDVYIYKIINHETGRFIGTVQLARFNHDLREAVVGRFLIGEREERGKGAGKAALLAMVKLGFNHFGLSKIKLNVYDFNHRAIGCYKSVGFVNQNVRENAYESAAGEKWNNVEMVIERERFEAAEAGGKV